MNTTRPLKPEQIAILRAIVELGDNAYGVPVRHRLEELLGRMVSVGWLYTQANWLEEEGFIRSFEGQATPERGNRAKRYWRPVFDLTDIIKE